MKGFVELRAKSSTGEFNTLVALDAVSSLLESTKWAQLVCKNGDIIPLKMSFKEAKRTIGDAINERDE